MSEDAILYPAIATAARLLLWHFVIEMHFELVELLAQLLVLVKQLSDYSIWSRVPSTV